jgi:hypothetical protein
MPSVQGNYGQVIEYIQGSWVACFSGSPWFLQVAMEENPVPDRKQIACTLPPTIPPPDAHTPFPLRRATTEVS